MINEDTAPKCFSCLLKDVNVQPTKVADKLCGENGCFVIRNGDYIEHLFSELYSVPVTHKKTYYKGLTSQTERSESDERMLQLVTHDANYVSEENTTAFMEWYSNMK